jgi:prophage regulatory protein
MVAKPSLFQHRNFGTFGGTVMTTKVLRFDDLAERGVPFTRKHIRTLESEAKFPLRVQLGTNSVGWLASDIDAWIASRPRGIARKPAE